MGVVVFALTSPLSLASIPQLSSASVGRGLRNGKISLPMPNTGKTVQGRTDNEPDPNGPWTWVSVRCLACPEVHLVNPVTAKLFGDEDAD